jgi:hypothetical protein
MVNTREKKDKRYQSIHKILDVRKYNIKILITQYPRHKAWLQGA